MAKKQPYEKRLTTLIGEMRQIPDRIGPVLSLVDLVDTLLECIREDHPNIKKIAETVQGAVNRAKEAIGTDLPD